MKHFYTLTPYLIALFAALTLVCAVGSGRFDFSARFCLAMTAALWLYRLIYRRRAAKWARICCRSFLAGFLAFILSFAAVQGLILHTQLTAPRKAADLAPGETPTLIVFGAALRGDEPTLVLIHRLETALDWLTAFPDGTAILSGGCGAGETVTEAACMADWLTARGVGEARLVLEDAARNTQENVDFSLPLVPEGASVTAVSNGFHLYRIDAILSRAGVDTQLLAAPMPNPGIVVSMAIREYFAIGKMWLGWLLG